MQASGIAMHIGKIGIAFCSLSRINQHHIATSPIGMPNKSANPVDDPTIHPYYPAFLPRAQMAELVDALRSGRSSRKGVEVRVLFWAPKTYA